MTHVTFKIMYKLKIMPKHDAEPLIYHADSQFCAARTPQNTIITQATPGCEDADLHLLLRCLSTIPLNTLISSAVTKSGELI